MRQRPVVTRAGVLSQLIVDNIRRSPLNPGPAPRKGANCQQLDGTQRQRHELPKPTLPLRSKVV